MLSLDRRAEPQVARGSAQAERFSPPRWARVTAGSYFCKDDPRWRIHRLENGWNAVMVGRPKSKWFRTKREAQTFMAREIPRRLGIEFCPRCEKQPKTPNDYLCWECRHGE